MIASTTARTFNTTLPACQVYPGDVIHFLWDRQRVLNAYYLRDGRVALKMEDSSILKVDPATTFTVGIPCHPAA